MTKLSPGYFSRFCLRREKNAATVFELELSSAAFCHSR